MTSTNYFGKMNSTLGSVVPLAMFKSLLLQTKPSEAEAISVWEVFLTNVNYAEHIFPAKSHDKSERDGKVVVVRYNSNVIRLANNSLVDTRGLYQVHT